MLVCTFAMSIMLIGQTLQSGPMHYDLGNWAPPYGIEYVVDTLSGFVMMFVSGIGAIVLTYAPASVDDEIPRSKQVLFYSGRKSAAPVLRGRAGPGTAC